MLYSLVSVLLVAVAMANTLRVDNMAEEKIICQEERFSSGLAGGACSRFVKGYDITGVTTTVVPPGTFNHACECMQACKDAFNTCNSWVWKFTDNSGMRSCTLYSNFNVPTGVTLAYDIPNSVNIEGVANPQPGGQVPHCTMDNTANTPHDKHCFSGMLMQLDDNKFVC